MGDYLHSYRDVKGPTDLGDSHKLNRLRLASQGALGHIVRNAVAE